VRWNKKKEGCGKSKVSEGSTTQSEQTAFGSNTQF
jgi:hypothetical protein